MRNIGKKFLVNYKEYKDKIYTYVLYRVDFNASIAEDLTSEVFMKAWEHYKNFDESRSFQAWIYAIAKNHLKNHYRTCNREIGLEVTKEISTDFKCKIEVDIELKRLVEEMKELKSSYREVLLMRFVDELSNKEIAEVLGKEEGAIRTHISRALNELRERINK